MDSKKAIPKRDAHITETVELAGADTVSIEGELVTWLDLTNTVGDDAAQRTVDATKALLAEQARQAADKLRPEK